TLEAKPRVVIVVYIQHDLDTVLPGRSDNVVDVLPVFRRGAGRVARGRDRAHVENAGSGQIAIERQGPVRIVRTAYRTTNTRCTHLEIGIHQHRIEPLTGPRLKVGG